MDSSHQKLRRISRAPRAGGQRNGFALILALTTMSFVLLLLLVMAALVKVETSASSLQLAQLQARQNALLGLMIALGDLQKHVGPDQRVTARADILGDDVADEARYWTGVWDSSNPSAPPVWLVSGENPNPESVANANRLVGPESVGNRPDDFVFAPNIELSNGQIAWWISDEGIKSNVLGGRHLDPSDTIDSVARRVTDYQLGQGVSLEPFGVSNSILFNNNGSVNGVIRNLATLHQMDLLSPPVDGQDRFINRAFHDATLFSHFVFQRAGTGGLKANLAAESILRASPVGDAGVKFLNTAQTLNLGTPVDLLPEISPGEAFFEPLPIPIELALYVGFFHTWSDARVRARFHLESEFWNPYSRTLRFPVDSDLSFDRAIHVEFRNMPEFRIEELPSGDIAPVAPILEGTMDTMFSGPVGNLQVDSLHSWVEIAADTNRGRPPFAPGLLPGEVYRVLEPPSNQPRGLARTVVNYNESPSLLWSQSRNQRPPDEATIRITFTPASTGAPEIIIRQWNAADPFAGRILARFQNLPFFRDAFENDGNFILEKTFNDGPNPFSRATSGSYLRDDYNLAFHVRLISDENDPGALRHLFSTLETRDRAFDYNSDFIDADGQSVSMASIIDAVSWNPVLAQQLDGDIFSDIDLFSSNVIGAHSDSLKPIIAFDIPNRNAACISVFRSLSFRERPAFSLGSPWGGDVNNLFDDFYFGADPALPTQGKNHWILDLAPQDSAASASAPIANLPDRFANGLLAAGFNINSTSPTAWASILSLLLRDGSANEITSAFFRTPLYAAAENKPVESPWVTAESDGSSNVPTPQEQYHLGGRRINDEQVRALGEIITALLKERGEPFLSLADFINSGIIQEAINLAHDESAINSRGLNGVTAAGIPINPSDVFDFSHAYLTQGDIVSRLAHTFSHRSDTFTIRARGITLNPFTRQPLGEAIVEAVIQRFPEKLDGSDPQTPTNALAGSDDSRQFRILSIRWLGNDSRPGSI